MRNILAARNLSQLVDFASSNVLLGFDFDGTLARVVSDPCAARMRVRTRRLLAEVAQRYPCVVISGRTGRDVRSRLDGVPLSHVFGNHGGEPWQRGGQAADTVRTWVRHLRVRLGGCPGLVVENKKYSVTVHYRRARNKQAARRLIAAAVCRLRDVRVLGGDQAVNLLVRGAPHKGDALQLARKAFACDTAIYVGNDDTDECAFTSGPADRLLSIRVGPARASHARYRLATQADIDRLLVVLRNLRSPGDPAASSASPRDG
jgi:trehalose 6-phosphate phosphatase